MDIYRLDPTTYDSPTLVEGFTSKIWTERYVTPGEFQFQTPKIEEMMAALPIDCLISLRDTEEVMMVDTHLIEEDEDGFDALTVKGVSVDGFFNDRVSSYDFSSTVRPTPDPGGSYAQPQTIIVQLLHYAGVGSTPPAWPALHSGDILPNVSVVDGITTLPGVIYSDGSGNTQERILKLLGQYGWGIRQIRPSSPGNDMVVEIYEGSDLTATVNFHVDRGDVTSPSYLISKRNYKTVAYVYAPIGARAVWLPGTSAFTTGFARRVLYVRADDLTEVPAGGATADSMLDQRGRDELQKYNQTFWFDGEISNLSEYKYKVDYNLGDLVTMRGNYGVSKVMRVNEFIRTEDAKGEESGYPTLVLPDGV